MAEENRTYIEWIGTGSGLNPTLGNTSFLVASGDRKILVDCGFTVPVELVKSGKLRDITDVVVTHTHSDHVGGLESLGFMNYFAYYRRNGDRPNLYLASESLRSRLWNDCLRGGMENIQDDQNLPIRANLESYFNVKIGKDVSVKGLPGLKLFPTPHVPGMENYGVRIGEDIFYSGDSLQLPPSEPRIIFQDCQFFEGKTDVHISYDKLKRELPVDVRAKTYLVHLGGGWDKKDARADGFAGFVKPGDRFYLEGVA